MGRVLPEHGTSREICASKTKGAVRSARTESCLAGSNTKLPILCPCGQDPLPGRQLPGRLPSKQALEYMSRGMYVCSDLRIQHCAVCYRQDSPVYPTLGTE
jgi:hypothetical protein